MGVTIFLITEHTENYRKLNFLIFFVQLNRTSEIPNTPKELNRHFTGPALAVGVCV